MTTTLADLERRLRALQPRVRGEARERLLDALGAVATLRGLSRDLAVARAIVLTLDVRDALAELDPPRPARGKPRGRPFQPKVTTDQVDAAVRQAPTLRSAGVSLGVHEATVSRRFARLRSTGSRTCTQ